MEGLDKEEETASISHIIYVAWQEMSVWMASWTWEARTSQDYTSAVQNIYTRNTHALQCIGNGQSQEEPIPQCFINTILQRSLK